MTNQTAIGLGMDVLRQQRDEILRLAAKHGAYNVRVFGSFARDEATTASDIDFLVDWDYNHISAWGGAGLFEELETLLGHPIDIATESQLHPSIRTQILNECVPL